MAVAGAEAAAAAARRPSLEAVRRAGALAQPDPDRRDVHRRLPDPGLGVPQAARGRARRSCSSPPSRARVGRYSFIGYRPRKVLRWSLGDPGDPYALAAAELGRFRAAELPRAAAVRRRRGRDVRLRPGAHRRAAGGAESRSGRPARPRADAHRRAGRLRSPQAHRHRDRQRLRRRRPRGVLPAGGGDDRRGPLAPRGPGAAADAARPRRRAAPRSSSPT